MSEERIWERDISSLFFAYVHDPRGRIVFVHTQKIISTKVKELVFPK